MKNTFTFLVLLTAASMIGCGRDGDAPPKLEIAKPSASPASPKESPKVIDVSRLTLPFAKAVIFDAPESQNRPPDLTMAGKNTAKMFRDIAGSSSTPGLWDQVALVSPEGKPIY